MNRQSGRLGLDWLRRLLDRLGRGRVYEQPASLIVGPPGNDDDEEDGPGVPVPVGPRPRRGGAQARPPVAEEAPELPTRR
ncbi:hypothetical protein [Deinococcus budaensis]|uniref:Uncharacterized protein n=1 Tax=Deinococcus budaensis TaxID=1665626 RepID=A0A7W8GDX8_9DEIO|nr:hypothetical protein [Deinococcus budaensis]MBB5233822.1 hypothetical protein [Deinococcus budaensis]